MKRIFTLLVFFLVQIQTAKAEGLDFYLGGGLGIGEIGVKESSADAKFRDFSYAAQGGILWPFWKDFGVTAGAAYGENKAFGSLDHSNYLENANNKFTVFRAGLLVYNVAVGGGIQQNDLRVKSVSTSSGEIESTYTGQTSYYFISYGLTSNSKGKGADFRTNVEISQTAGKLENLEYSETSISLNLVILLGLH